MALGAPSTGIAWMVLCELLVPPAGVGTVLLAGRLVASRRLPISPGPPRRARRPLTALQDE